jgi:antitoxin component YwqK of YwqJK toxin-antitoxin module
MFANVVKAQRIIIEDYNIVLANIKSPCQSNIIEHTRDGKKITIQLLDCMGKMNLKVYRNNKILEEGSYINSLDTLKGYVYKKTLGSFEKEIVVERYFQPLRDGTWRFYNSKGILYKKVNYIRGVEAG